MEYRFLIIVLKDINNNNLKIIWHGLYKRRHAMGHGMGHGMGSGAYDYTWILLAFIGLLLIIGIALFIARLYHHSDKRRNSDNEETPLEILKKRYARGEIDKEEFEQRKRNLNSFVEPDKNETALEIIERRYALGEIDKEELEQKKKYLLD
jgi:putative membrane protein